MITDVAALFFPAGVHTWLTAPGLAGRFVGVGVAVLAGGVVGAAVAYLWYRRHVTSGGDPTPALA